MLSKHYQSIVETNNQHWSRTGHSSQSITIPSYRKPNRFIRLLATKVANTAQPGCYTCFDHSIQFTPLSHSKHLLALNIPLKKSKTQKKTKSTTKHTFYRETHKYDMQ